MTDIASSSDFFKSNNPEWKNMSLLIDLLRKDEELRHYSSKKSIDPMSFSNGLMAYTKKSIPKQIDNEYHSDLTGVYWNPQKTPAYQSSNGNMDSWTGWYMDREISKNFQNDKLFIPLNQFFSLVDKKQGSYLYQSIHSLSKIKNWFTIGVVGFVKDSILQKKKTLFRYQSILLYDMIHSIALQIFILYNSTKLHQLDVGHVIALFNPNSQDIITKQTHPLIFPQAFIINANSFENRKSSFMILGKARDFSYCSPMNNASCKIPVNVLNSRSCEIHIERYVKHCTFSRAELDIPYHSTINSHEYANIEEIDAIYALKNGMEIDTLAQLPKSSEKKMTLQNNTFNRDMIYHGSSKNIKISHESLKPQACSKNAIDKMGFDPSASRKKPFIDLLKSIPNPVLGREYADNGYIDLNL